MSRRHAHDRMSDPRVLRGTSADHLDVLVGAIVPYCQMARRVLLLVRAMSLKEELSAGKFFPPF